MMQHPLSKWNTLSSSSCKHLLQISRKKKTCQTRVSNPRLFITIPSFYPYSNEALLEETRVKRGWFFNEHSRLKNMICILPLGIFFGINHHQSSSSSINLSNNKGRSTIQLYPTISNYPTPLLPWSFFEGVLRVKNGRVVQLFHYSPQNIVERLRCLRLSCFKSTECF